MDIEEISSFKKVEIEWIDSKSGPNEWEYIEDLNPLPPVQSITVGFLVDDSPDYKTVASTISDSQVHGRITIPKACILNVKEI